MLSRVMNNRNVLSYFDIVNEEELASPSPITHVIYTIAYTKASVATNFHALISDMMLRFNNEMQNETE